MNHLQNKGFTLVELMVVIVIMGVLAAVGVPKLTSAVAKSKASEVAPAATTYIKLQSAYVMEHKQIGAWKRIGYSKPKSDNFSYDRGDIKSRTKIDDLGEAGLVGWIATNKVGMGDCKLGNTWKVILQQGGTDSDGSVKLNFETEVSDAACAALAGDWTKVSKETQVAATTPEKTYKFVGNQVEMASGDDGKIDGKYTFGKALISGKQSASTDVDMSDYGFSGYVFSNAASAELKSSLEQALGISFSAEMKVQAVTELYDVAGTEKLGAGTYKGRMNLYYAQNVKGTKVYSSNLYGYRDVYVKVNNAGQVISYCLDESCTQTIGKDKVSVDMDGWITEDIKQDVDDPFDQVSESMLASSPLSVNQAKSENSDIVSAINNKTTDAGKPGYNTVDGVIGVVSSMDATTALKTWLSAKEPASSGKTVRIVSQVFSENPVKGTLYAATVSLYYGSSTEGFVFYERRKVYAIQNNDNGSGNCWSYVLDKEGLTGLNANLANAVNSDVFWQSDMGKME